MGDDVLPSPLGGDPNGYPIGKGADIFISVWNLHRFVSTMSQSLLHLTRCCNFHSCTCGESELEIWMAMLIRLFRPHRADQAVPQALGRIEIPEQAFMCSETRYDSMM